MIVVMRPEATEEQLNQIVEEMQRHNLEVQINEGVHCKVLGALGDTAKVDKERFSLLPGVDRVVPVQEPFKKANRKFHPENTVVDVGGVKIGGSRIVIGAGPCSVENELQLNTIAKSIAASGSDLLRGGAFKPRTSPYAFQGLKEEGLRLLKEAKELTGMPVITELMSEEHLDLFAKYEVDMIQIGARNMQNFELLKHVGELKTPVLLKRGLSSTIQEWLMSAEYIMAQGNAQVVLCERGIRTFETYTRNTLDLSAIPAIKKLSHLPVVVDPSHAAGLWWMVEPLAMAAIAVGADGLLVEVHNTPEKALSDGAQSLTPHGFDMMMERVRLVAQAAGRLMNKGVETA